MMVTDNSALFLSPDVSAAIPRLPDRLVNWICALPDGVPVWNVVPPEVAMMIGVVAFSYETTAVPPCVRFRITARKPAPSAIVVAVLLLAVTNPLPQIGPSITNFGEPKDGVVVVLTCKTPLLLIRINSVAEPPEL